MRIIPVLLAVCLGLSPRLALAGAFDGKWVADIPAQGGCTSTATMVMVVAGDSIAGETHNPTNVIPFTGKVDADGNATFVAGNRYPGTMTFTRDHFDATWNNGACDRHAQGDRAPDPKQMAALAEQRKQHQGAYAELIRRAESGDKTVDYTALRAESVYAEDWNFYDNKVNGLLDQASAAVAGKDCVLALQKLDQVIKLDFTIDSAHALRSDCLKRTGQADRARVESDIADGLIHSLMDSASRGDHGVMHALSNDDGQTEQTAYVVGTLREEMDVLANRHIQLKFRQTEIRGSNGHYYDLIKGVSIRSGAGAVDVSVKSVYFDITNFVTGRASRRAVTQTTLATIH